MHGHALAGLAVHEGGVGLTPLFPLFHGPTDGEIAIHRIVRTGLIGHSIWFDALLHHLRKDLGGVAKKGDGDRLAIGFGLIKQLHGMFEIGCLRIDVAGAESHIDATLLAFDGEHTGTGHGSGSRLGAAHAPESGREDPTSGPIAVVVLPRHLGKGLVCALNNALATNIDPTTGSHLAVHHQTLGIEFVEMLPIGPVRYEIAVGNQHTGRIGMSAEHAHRLSALDEQGFGIVQLLERGDDLIERLPVTGRLADSAVHHQIFRTFGHIRIEIVHQHAQWCFGEPAFGVELRACRCMNHARFGGGHRQNLLGASYGGFIVSVSGVSFSIPPERLIPNSHWFPKHDASTITIANPHNTLDRELNVCIEPLFALGYSADTCEIEVIGFPRALPPRWGKRVLSPIYRGEIQ